jgi:hypothetical protein
MRALEAERFLAGRRLEEAVVREAAALVAGSTGPIARPAADCLEPVKELTHRAIVEALKRVRTDATT